VQYDGIELSDCSTLIFAFRQMRDFALADNNPENILGSLKYYLEKYEPKELKEMEKEELVEHYKKSMNIKKMATELKQKRGGSIANTEYKASVLIQNVNSRLHDSGKICARLQDITPGKVWKVNLKNNIAWLELNDINEAKDIVVHFNTHGYSNIKLEFKKNTTIPLVWINFINFEKLEKIPQMSLLQNQNFLTRKPNI
jgi:DNA repair ATPase RecN